MISISWIDASYIGINRTSILVELYNLAYEYIFYLAINLQNLNQPIHIIDCISNEE